jgi:uncharacterized membrane protein
MAEGDFSGNRAAPAKKLPTAGISEIAAAIFWSFLGVRKRKDYENDTVRISLKQVVVAGIIGGILFVVGVIFLVRMILANLGAGTA